MPENPTLISKFTTQLFKPCLLCICLALLLFGGQLIFAGYLLAPERVKHRAETDLLVNETDNHTHAAVAALKAQAREGGIQLFCLGGSSIRECFYEDRQMARRLSTAWQRPVGFTNLSTFSQTLVETLVLTLNLPIDENTIIILGVNPRLLSTGMDDVQSYRYGGRLPFIVRPVRQTLQALTGIDAGFVLVPDLLYERAYLSRYILSRFEFPYLERLNRYLTGKRKKPPRFKNFFRFHPVEFYLAHPFPDENLSMAEKHQMAYRIRTENIDRFFQNQEYAFGLLDQLIDHVHERGGRIILLQAPRSELSFDAYRAVMDTYNPSLEQVRQSHALTLVPFPRMTMFSEDDFHDLDHLNRHGRKKYVPWLIEQLDPIIVPN